MAKGGGTKCWLDKTSELLTYADKWLEDGSFPTLEAVKILYTWVDPPRLDSEGMEISGRAQKLPNSVRDVFGHDFIVEIAQSKWQELDEEEKSRLIWHELRHCQTKLTEAGDVAQDSQGRVKIYLAKHDVCLHTFSDELAEFGLSKEELGLAKTLMKIAKRQREGKEEQPGLAAAGKGGAVSKANC